MVHSDHGNHAKGLNDDLNMALINYYGEIPAMSQSLEWGDQEVMGYSGNQPRAVTWFERHDVAKIYIDYS